MRRRRPIQSWIRYLARKSPSCSSTTRTENSHVQEAELQTRQKAPRRCAEKEERGRTGATGGAQEGCARRRPSVMEQPEAADGAASSESAVRVIAATRNWVEKAVIGLRLCPFAASPYLRGLIRYRVSEQESPEGL